MKIKVVIVGNGKLASGFVSDLANYDVNKFIKYVTSYKDFDKDDTDINTVFVHVGSGRQYHESLKLALNKGATYIQAATEKGITMENPISDNIKFINSPNLCINIIKFFYWLIIGSKLFNGDDIRITESHQSDKVSVPGTAYKMCDLMEVPYKNITSIRDKEKQKLLNIENLNQHAYHQVKIGGEDSLITMETKIEGMRAYTEGLYRIIQKSIDLLPGIYEIEELVEKGLL